MMGAGFITRIDLSYDAEPLQINFSRGTLTDLRVILGAVLDLRLRAFPAY